MTLDEAIIAYENKLTQEIQEAGQNSIIATINQDNNNPILIGIGEVKMFQFGGTKHIGQININIGDKSIKIYTRIQNNQNKDGFNLKISLLQNGGNIHRNASRLINIDKEARSIRFEKISWTTQGQQFQQHKNFWYKNINNQDSLVQWNNDFFDELKINLDDRGMSVSSKELACEISFTEEDQAEEIDEAQRDNINRVAKIHAKSIIMRCVDWILYHAKITNANADFVDGENKSIKDAFDGIDFDPRQEQAHISRRISPYNLKNQCEANGLYYSDDVYQIISTSMNLGRHLILTGPPGCGKSRLAALVGEMINNKAPKIVTASPSWTSGEIVGRYFPRHGDGKLRFHPGVFLQASEENRCVSVHPPCSPSDSALTCS